MTRPGRIHALVLGLSALAAPAAVQAQDHCAACHVTRSERALREPVAAQAASAHGAADMSCADCHGGAREDPTARAHDPARGFVARPGAAEIPALCGGCHGDRERLGDDAERLGADQLERFRRSGHGRALARGNEAAATCVGCHGAHNVAAASEEESLTHPENVAPVCGGCHSDPSTMTAGGLPLNQLARWRRSVHGLAFSRDDGSGAPTCNGCHDAHGGSTGIDDVTACGRCHEDQEQSFEQSPHAGAFGRLGFTSCTDCHGSHDVRPAHASLVGVMRDSTCRLCHNEQQPAVFATIRRLGELRAAAATAERRGREALGRLAGPATRPGAARTLAERLDRAAADLDHGLHAFDDAVVEHAVTEMTEIAARAVALERAGQPDRGASTLPMTVLVAAAVLAAILTALLFRVRR